MRVSRFEGRRLAGTVGAVAAGLGGQSLDAAVIYTPVDVDIPADIADYSVDLNGDAANEFDIQQFEGIIKVADTVAGNGVALDGDFTANLAAGTLIDSSLTYGAPTNDALTGTAGNFQVSDGPGFIGVQFLIGGNTHYGYVGYEGAGAEGSANGHVYALGYDDTPDTAIAAGAGIPEPTSLALLAAGAVGLSVYRRRSA